MTQERSLCSLFIRGRRSRFPSGAHSQVTHLHGCIRECRRENRIQGSDGKVSPPFLSWLPRLIDVFIFAGGQKMMKTWQKCTISTIFSVESPLWTTVWNGGNALIRFNRGEDTVVIVTRQLPQALGPTSRLFWDVVLNKTSWSVIPPRR